MACLLNPYFFNGVIFPFKLWKTLHSKIFQPNITEFMSPWLHNDFLTMQDAQLWGYKVFSIFLFILLITTFKKRRFHEFALAIIFFYLSSTAVRNVPLFILACLPIFADCWNDMDFNWLRKFQEIFLARNIVAWGLTLFLLCLSLRIISNDYYLSDYRLERFGLGIDGENQPDKAVSFLVQNHLNGRILNSLNTGGWLDWKAPQKIFIDGRLEVMGEELFAEYINSQNPVKITTLADKYSADIIFFNINDSLQWIFDLQSNENWRPVYLDGNSVIYLRKNYAPQIPMLDDSYVVAANNIQPQILNQSLDLITNPRPSSWNCFWKGFYDPVDYPSGILNMGKFFFASNHPNTAEAFFLEALKLSRGRYWDIYCKLSFFYYQFKRYDISRLCVDEVLKNNPNNNVARQMLENIPIK